LAATLPCLAILQLGFGGQSAKPVAVSKWVTAVCTAETTLKSSATSEFSALQASAAANPFDPATAKSVLVNFLQTATPEAQRLASQLKAAGAPQITNGAKVAQLYVSTAQSLAASLAADLPQVIAIASSGLKGLDTATTMHQSATQMANQQVKKLLKDNKVDRELVDCGGVFALGSGRGHSRPSTTAPLRAGR
jgi:flagellar motor switch protein FliG